MEKVTEQCCADSYCQAGACRATECTYPSGACSVDEECCPGSLCEEGQCCLDEGSTCSEYMTPCCAPHVCTLQGVCGSCAPPGQACTSETTCCDGQCGADGTCCALPGAACGPGEPCCTGSQCVQGRCCGGLSQPCDDVSECCTGLGCHDGSCCSNVGGSCAVHRDCCGYSGMLCSGGRCLYIPSMLCTSGTECLSGSCTDGHCDCQPIGGLCSSFSECCDSAEWQSLCEEERCCKGNLGACSANDECCSGYCDGMRCQSAP
jgi:hypothetical protein